MKGHQGLTLIAKRFYWAQRHDPFFLAQTKNILRSLNSKLELTIHRIAGKAHSGHCPICETRTTFVIKNAWLRDYYLCEKCGSIPRARHLMSVLHRHFPNYRELAIHESSPCGASFEKFARVCPHYVASYFWPDVKPGSSRNGYRCENLEALTFPDNHFDLVITQDVMEHVMHPDRAFSEIARTLKPGGSHVFTIPWYATRSTVIRATESGGVIRHLLPPEYHGNPIDNDGALVVTEWGRNLPEFIFRNGGLVTSVFLTLDRTRGLAGDFLEVFVSHKPT